jgi:tripartite-type tricarboxylate transporter receptor subunit TctC
VDSGKLMLLCTYGSKRAKRWPNVPTLNELGYQTANDSPFGIVGPKGMDPAVVKTLHDAFRKALYEPKVMEMLDRYDQPLIYMNSADYTEWAKKTFAAEAQIIERIGMKGSM